MSEIGIDTDVKKVIPLSARTYKLHPSRFNISAVYTRKEVSAVPVAGTPFDALLEPSYWAHVAEKLRPYDEIVVMSEDMTYYARFLVLASSRMSAKVFLLHKWDLTGQTIEDDATPFAVMWRGPHHKHAVVRMSDKQAVQVGFDTREAATAWLAANLRSLTAS